MAGTLGNQNSCQVMSVLRRVTTKTESRNPNIYPTEEFHFGDISVIIFHLKFSLLISIENFFWNP